PFDRVGIAYWRIRRGRHVAQQSGFEFEFLPDRKNGLDRGERRQVGTRLTGLQAAARRARRVEDFPRSMQTQHDEGMMAVDILAHERNLSVLYLPIQAIVI